MKASDVILLCLLALLFGYLYWRHWQRPRRDSAESQWPGHGIDVGSITCRVQHLRNDFLTELQGRPPDISRRRSLLASARQVVEQFSFFRRRPQSVDPAPPAHPDILSPL